uniref:G_PROTEIN_RECEP_F1_2 domain-containing protein n=1 Tax=Macrostomum lignano TaxID=282301 RepID=A0A1I8JLQ3_9PLAT
YSLQLIQFQVARGPWETDFYQCVSIAMNPPKSVAGIVHHLQLAYMIFNIVVIFLLPTFVLTLAYGRLIRTIIVTMRQFENAATPCKSRTTTESTDNTELTAVSTAAGADRALDSDRVTARECREASSYINSSRKSLLQRAKIRSFQMFSVIILVFVLLWLPYWVLYILTCVGKLTGAQY